MRRQGYKNRAEGDFAILAEKNGWAVTKRGWPDFICFGPDDEVIVVEVKPTLQEGLRRDQLAVMDFLQSKGIRCFVSDGKTLEPYGVQVKVRTHRRKREHAQRRLRSIG